MFRFVKLLSVLWLVALGGAFAQDLAENTARIHYTRPDGVYDGWKLHVWEDTTETVTWENGLDVTGEDDYGVYWDVGLTDDAQTLGFIVHKGDEKDPGPDMFLTPGEMGYEVWIVSGNDTIYTQLPDTTTAAPKGDLGKAQAHWLSRDTVAWNLREVPEGAQVTLHYAPDAGLTLGENGLEGGESVVLEPAGALNETLQNAFPHLAGYQAFRVPETADVAAILRGQTAVSYTDAEGTLQDATGLQIPGVLDDLYANDQPLGVTWEGDTPTLSVWAPTAQDVKLHLFENADTDDAQVLGMSRDDATGVWSTTGDANWKGQYYLYEVQVYAPTTQVIETNLVTDPYSHSLSMNSTRSQIVDLNDAALKPEGWDGLEKPPLATFEDVSVYELHMRDFSVGDEGVPLEQQGTYLAFTHPDSSGMTHLRNLAEAGLTHLHLLPTFDIATINENKSEWREPEGDLASFPPDSPKQQAAVGEVRGDDGYNWGYDPYHYTVPEGSYATDPEGAGRVLEYRQMVEALNESGLRFVMDVVYNHTNASGQDERSVLDKVVPGYYHRLNADGFVETSTCCQNTATEHAMMERLMIDSLLTWAEDYKVDGFRFDLMGHHMLANMQNVREALDELTLEEDGVDGANIYVYGEGWNFGEVADNARGVNATQANVAGMGIGTFNDRLRDAVRGGGPFDSPEGKVTNQGFISGLYYAPNAAVEASLEEQKDRLLLAADQIRVGLAGNLAGYIFMDRNGETVTGADVDYNGSPTGYTQDPQENIVYVSAHDNETLWDISQYKHAADTPLSERVRAQNMGLAIVALSQGVPFFHAGSDMLRSKSLDRDSYDSGDWFNKLDFSYGANNWGVGLPPAWANEEGWPLMRPLLTQTALRTNEAAVTAAVAHLREMLEIRQSSPLFHLQTADEVKARLTFYNTGPAQVPGIIVMGLSDEVGEDLGPNYEAVVVVFNATDEMQRLPVLAFEGQTLSLHPVQRASGDVQSRFSRFEEGTFIVQPRTTAVFVLEP